jgi:hypothetical protein
LFPPRDPNGVMLNGLTLLDAFGQQLQPSGNPPTMSILNLYFNVVGQIDFNQLGLFTPNSVPQPYPNLT